MSPSQSTYLIVLAALGAVVGSARSETKIDVIYTTPTVDRWNYPFNPNPGTNATASTFGNEAGSPLFDNRDGQMVLGWDTSADVPTGRVLSSYIVASMKVTLQFASDDSIQYDVTTDPWNAFIPPRDPNYVQDRDPGQPFEIFGTGFRNGFTLQTWQEGTAYAPDGADFLAPGVRSAYALGFNGDGQVVDVSDSVRDHFSPDPFATGIVPGLSKGNFIPINSKCVFDISTDNPIVQGYLQQGLAVGKLNLSVTSLARVVQQGPAPRFYCKENPLVKFGVAQAARLDLTVLLVDCGLYDLDCNGVVGSADLGILLGAWGSSDPKYDFDGSGAVGSADLGLLLGAWGTDGNP